MCRVRAKVRKGPIPTERVAYIETVCGKTAEVIVSSSKAGLEDIEVTEIRREPGRVLVELPQEATTGDWRLWVAPNQVFQT
jgi:hypothetical protein